MIKTLTSELEELTYSFDGREKMRVIAAKHEAAIAELVEELRSYEDCYLGPNTKRLIAKHGGSQ